MSCNLQIIDSEKIQSPCTKQGHWRTIYAETSYQKIDLEKFYNLFKKSTFNLFKKYTLCLKKITMPHDWVVVSFWVFKYGNYGKLGDQQP